MTIGANRPRYAADTSCIQDTECVVLQGAKRNEFDRDSGHAISVLTVVRRHSAWGDRSARRGGRGCKSLSERDTRTGGGGGFSPVAT
jgi:hypothetical protein